MTLFCILTVLRIAAAGVLLLLISVKDLRSRRLPAWAVRLLAAFSLLRAVPWIAALSGISPEPPGLPGGSGTAAFFSVLFDMFLGGAGTLLLLLAVTRLSDRILCRETLGGGDVRLAAALGLHLGLWPALLMLLSASLLALPGAFIRRRRGERGFPFAPYLSAAGFALLILSV